MSKLALVTGGTTGIGAAICIELKAAGYTVVANNIVHDEIAETFSKENGVKTYFWDVTDPEACLNGVRQIESDHGQTIDVLINNAGIARDAAMHKMTLDQWDIVLKTDLFSLFYMSRAVINQMRDKKFGRIVNISSINGLAGQFGQTNYSSAKAGMLGFTKALALECAAKNITVNAVAPGYTDTAMMQAVPSHILKTIIEKIPAGRLGRPEEVARAVRFLASDEASFVTGETISVNGGQYMY